MTTLLEQLAAEALTSSEVWAFGGIESRWVRIENAARLLGDPPVDRSRLARALHVVDNDFGGGCAHTQLPTDIDQWDAIERDHGLYAGRLAGEYDR